MDLWYQCNGSICSDKQGMKVSAQSLSDIYDCDSVRDFCE